MWRPYQGHSIDWRGLRGCATQHAANHWSTSCEHTWTHRSGDDNNPSLTDFQMHEDERMQSECPPSMAFSLPDPTTRRGNSADFHSLLSFVSSTSKRGFMVETIHDDCLLPGCNLKILCLPNLKHCMIVMPGLHQRACLLLNKPRPGSVQLFHSSMALNDSISRPQTPVIRWHKATMHSRHRGPASCYKSQ